MKNIILLVAGLMFMNVCAHAQRGFAHQKFTVRIMNSTFFDLHADPLPDEGEGYFMVFTPTLKKGKSFLYECENPNALKGVEGHLKLKASNNEVPGIIDIYFDNPAIGSMKWDIKADWPYRVSHVIPFAEKRTVNLWIEITADTVNHGPAGGAAKVSVSNSAPGGDELIPEIIQFDWLVQQRMPKDEDDDEGGKGMAYKNVTYYFTTSGDYAGIRMDEKTMSYMVYSKKGHTWMIDDKKKTITVMNMPKVVGGGALMAKEFAEGVSGKPLRRDKDDESFTITKTGKTKNVLGYTAEEFLMKNNKVLTTSGTKKTGTISFWYAKVPFDPVKIYTMGVGRPADLGKLQNDPRMKNNITAIPVLNKNFLWVETETGGMKGMETTEIRKVFTTIRTAGYTVKDLSKKGLKELMQDNDK